MYYKYNEKLVFFQAKNFASVVEENVKLCIINVE